MGLVRLRVKKTTEALARIFDEINKKVEEDKSAGPFEESPFAEISDEDIDSLFR